MRSTSGALAFIALGVVVWVACTGSEQPTAPDALDRPSFASGGVPGGTDKCPSGENAKDESGPPWSITAPAGQVIGSVCVKAGTYVYIASADGVISRNGTSCFVVDFSADQRTVHRVERSRARGQCLLRNLAHRDLFPAGSQPVTQPVA